MTEKVLTGKKNGMVMLLLIIGILLASVAALVFGIILTEKITVVGVVLIVLSVIGFIVGSILPAGLKVLKPQEALVLTLFGNYTGTLKGEGFYFVNPFSSAVNPAASTKLNQSGDVVKTKTAQLNVDGVAVSTESVNKRMSMKIMTLNNNRQKINDCLGNPVEIGIAVTWRIVDTAKAAFNVDNYKEFLSLQCDSALRDIVRLYPYDVAPNVDTTGDGVADDGSLRGSSAVVAERIKAEIQSRVEEAGLEIVDARITYLAYAPEIAAAMLQRQQAAAVVDARKLIVDGADPNMARQWVNYATKILTTDNRVIQLDEERKAAMVSNLLVVLCGNKEAQPIVNSGSLY